MFIGNQDGNSLTGRMPIKKTKFPSFIDKLTLRLSVKIPTAREQTGTQELNPRDLWLPKDQEWALQSAALLRKHISSPRLWDVKVQAYGDQATSMSWRWIPPREDCVSQVNVREKKGEVYYHKPCSGEVAAGFCGFVCKFLLFFLK
jgi:hypothetical protein